MAIRALGNGAPRPAVAQVFDVSERTLCAWIRAFNGGGIDALLDKKRRGRPRVLDPQSFAQQVAPLLADPAAAGECHWTAVKLHGYLHSALHLELGYSTLVRQLHEHGWVLRIPRPRSTWALKGSHPLTKQTGAHVRLNVIGAVAPATGACSALIFDGCDTDVFQVFLDTLAADAPPM